MKFILLLLLSLSAFGATTKVPVSMVKGACSYYGSVRFTGCSGNWSNASTTYASLGTNTCTVTATGSVSAPLTTVPGFRILGRPLGRFKFEAYGNFGKSVTTTNSLVVFTFRDTTNSTNSYDNAFNHTSSAGAQLTGPFIGGSLGYVTTGDTSYEIYGKTSTTTSSTLAAIFATSEALSIDVYYCSPQ